MAVQAAPREERLGSYERLRRTCHERLATELRLDIIPPHQRADHVRGEILRYLFEQRAALPTAQREQLITEILQDALGYGPITPLLADDTVSEIMVNGPEQAYVERDGRLEATPIRFRDSSHVMQVIERIVAPIGRRVDDSSPMVDARLPDGSRVNVIIPPVSRVGPVLTIRKFTTRRLGADDLVRLGALTPGMLAWLRHCVQARLSILVSGGTASGKTTLLNVLSQWADRSERIISIEDVAELQLDHPHWISLESRPSNIEGKGEITPRDLLRNALRMRPDRILVGEVRGAEAWELIKALNTGHDGGMSTIHANNAAEALHKLGQYLLETGVRMPYEALNARIAGAIHLVVHVHRYHDGSRKVSSITEVVGCDGGEIQAQDLVVFRQLPSNNGQNGPVRGEFVVVGTPVRLPTALADRGYSMPEVALV